MPANNNTPTLCQLVEGLCKAIAEAHRAGDLARAESLTDALAHQLDLAGLLDEILSDDTPTQ